MVRAGFSLLLALPAPQPATVLSIGDGDTLRLRQGARTLTVRLACIDAPEIAQAPWGQQASRQLQTLAPIGSAVTLRSKTTDRYGRLVVELNSKGRNLNQALVASGAAFVYWRYISGCDRQTYSRLETEARLQRLGVWSTPGGIIRPWDVRRARRTGSGPAANTPGGQRYRCSEIGSYALGPVLGGGRPAIGRGAGSGCSIQKLGW
jgi:endonuclease YncB( thermonuclease family)